MFLTPVSNQISEAAKGQQETKERKPFTTFERKMASNEAEIT